MLGGSPANAGITVTAMLSNVAALRILVPVRHPPHGRNLCCTAACHTRGSRSHPSTTDVSDRSASSRSGAAVHLATRLGFREHQVVSVPPPDPAFLLLRAVSPSCSHEAPERIRRVVHAIPGVFRPFASPGFVSPARSSGARNAGTNSGAAGGRRYG